MHRPRRWLPAEDAASAIAVGKPPFFGHERVEARLRIVPFDAACLIVQPPDRCKFLLTAEPGVPDCRSHHPDRLVIDLQRHREGMPVLAAMREGEARWIGEAVWRTMNHLGDRRQGPHRPRADTRHQQQFSEILRATIGRRRETGVKPRHQHILGADIVMGRHDQMRQTAFFRSTPGWPEGDVQGVTAPSGDAYDLSAAWKSGRLVLTLKDRETGKSGRITFT
jgi:hypothetical protein